MVKLYSTDCPRCKVLEKKLEQSNVEFEKITEFNIEEMLKEGFSSAPILEVYGVKLDYIKAIKWINEGGK